MSRAAILLLPPRRRQAGATLIVGLVLLLVLTVVGVSGMNMATMEITMAGNTQFRQDAFQAAEDARAGDGLLAAQLWLGAGSRAEVPAGMEEVARQRAELQGRLDELRRQKGALAEELYESELERLLLEIARLDQRLREARARAGASPEDSGSDDPESGA